MKELTHTVIAILLIVMTSATTVSMMTITPAKPIDTAVVTGSPETMKASILVLVKRGYIVKSAIPASVSDYNYENGMVILEKY